MDAVLLGTAGSGSELRPAVRVAPRGPGVDRAGPTRPTVAKSRAGPVPSLGWMGARTERAPPAKVIGGRSKSTTTRPLMASKPNRRIPARLNDVDAAATMKRPEAHEITVGHVWPSVTGRSNIARAAAGAVPTIGMLVPWAPHRSLQLHNEDWFLHTSPLWVFDEEEGRRFLHRSVQRLVGRASDVPGKRTLALVRDDCGYRLWLATPRCDSVALDLLAAIVEWPVWTLPARMSELVAELRAHVNGCMVDSPIAAGAFGLSREEGRLCSLAFEDDVSPPIEGRVVSDDLIDLSLEWFGDNQELRRMIERRTRNTPGAEGNR